MIYTFKKILFNILLQPKLLFILFTKPFLDSYGAQNYKVSWFEFI
jgi:hypothetical protein